MSQRTHPWHHAATYIRALFREATHPIMIATAEHAALHLDKAADEAEEIETNSEHDNDDETE